jgi:hypothetical protein
MRAQKSRWSRLWAAAVFALAGAACSSEHLGMNPQGSGGDGSGPCPGSTLCPPLGTGGSVGTGGIKGAGGSGGTVLDAGSICDQIASKYQTALAVARACTPVRRISARRWWGTRRPTVRAASALTSFW